MASELSASNPDLIESIRRNARHGNPTQSEDDNDHDNHSAHSAGISLERMNQSKISHYFLDQNKPSS